MAVAGGAHALHDGYTDLIYVMLPIWQAEFGLSYAAIGLLRGMFAGTMAGFQIPAGLLSERLGAPLVLARRHRACRARLLPRGAVAGFSTLIATLLIAGLGASTQHPLASALVARAFAGRVRSGARHLQFRRRYRQNGAAGGSLAAARADALAADARAARRDRARGGAGDLRRSRRAMAGGSRQGRRQTASRIRRRAPGFPLLLSIGVIDSATRMGFSPSCRSCSPRKAQRRRRSGWH